MAEASISIREAPDVKELLALMQAPGYQSQRQDYTSLLNYVDTLTKQYNSILTELETLKEKVSGITDRKNPLVVMVENLESLAVGIGEKLRDLRDGVVSFTKNALETVKEKGLSALGSVFDFLHVKDGLQAMSRGLLKSVDALDKAVTRVENLEKHNGEKAIEHGGDVVTQSAGEKSSLAELLVDTRFDFENLSQEELAGVYEKLLSIGMNNDLSANENKCLQSLVIDAGNRLPYAEEYEPVVEVETEHGFET